MLTFESVHVAISVSIGDTLNREPTHTCEKDPAELVRKFVAELNCRGENIGQKVAKEFGLADARLLPKTQQKKNRRLDRPGAGAGVQLGVLRPQPDPRALRGAENREKQGTMDHGAVVTAVYRTIEYQPGKIFPWFVEQVTEARRTGDTEKSKALLVELLKLLGNRSYGKLIEAVERQKT